MSWKEIWDVDVLSGKMRMHTKRGSVIGELLVLENGRTEPVDDGEWRSFDDKAEAEKFAAGVKPQPDGASPKEDFYIGKHCLICTDKDKRGVFFGVVESYNPETLVMVAREVRMVIYWSKATNGVLGLAAKGPAADCRISDAIPRARIEGVTFIGVASE